MPILLAWLSFLFIFLSLRQSRFTSGSQRADFLTATVVWGVLTVACAEILSVFHALRFASVCTFWVLIAVVSGFFALRLRPNRPFSIFQLSLAESLGIASVVVIAGILATIAWIAPPNNSDSMAYHMSRVVHWIQNQSLENYPTNILRQLSYPPGAEYLILHFQILSGGDRFANFVQWFAMAGSMLGVSLIAQYLGADRRGQILAAVVAVTIPMGILQASGTQNDYVVTFWLVCFVVSIHAVLKRLSWLNIFLSGAALGLCFLTKGTGYLYGLPFFLLFSIYYLRKDGFKYLGHLACILAIALWLNAGYLMRNAQLYQSNIFAPATQTVKIHNQSVTVKSFITNIVQNAGIHVSTPFQEINKGLRATTNPLHEDNAGNLLHMIVLVIGGVVFLCTAKVRSVPILKYYLLAIVLGIVLFNLTLAWQPFHSRFHLPIFILLSPWVAAVLSLVFSQTFLAVGMIVLVVGAAPWIFFNEARPFLGPNNIFVSPRIKQYFANLPGTMYSYKSAAEEVLASGCRDVGIKLRENSWEYPLWVFLGKDVYIEHFDVNNVSTRLSRTFDPCALVVIDNPYDQNQAKIVGDNKTFVRTRHTAYTQVFILDPDGQLSRRSLEYYFNEAVNLMNQSAHSKDIRKTVYLRKKALKAALFVEPQELDALSQELANQWRVKLIEGLTRFIKGVEHQDEQELYDGLELLGQWQLWLVNNKSNVQKVFVHEN